MNKKLIPDYYAISIYHVPLDFYRRNGISNLLLDLDNTLDSYRAAFPSAQAAKLVNDLRKLGYQVLIVSNNHGPRVKNYADSLGVPYLAAARKPFAKKFVQLMRQHQLSPATTLLIGDQLMTDVIAAHNAKIRVMLTEKLVPEDQWTTRINRLFDRPLRRKLKKQQRLPDWRKFYE